MALLLFKWWLPFCFGLLGVTTPASAPHPFYVSVTEINQNTTEKTLEISCKLFAEDLEDVLKQQYKTTIDLTNAKQHAQNDKLVKDYLVKHLSFKADGKPLILNYIGFEKDAESTYGYFEVPGVAGFKKLEVFNSVLQDFNDQQINIMHVIVNGSRKSYKLDYPNKVASFTF